MIVRLNTIQVRSRCKFAQYMYSNLVEKKKIDADNLCAR